MKFLKYFESEEQYREVDLQQLYDDYVKYKTNEEHIWVITKRFEEDVLDPLLDDKRIQYFDSYFFVRDITLNFDGENVYVHLNYYYTYTIQRIISYREKIPMSIKIYDSEETEFEKEIDLLKNTEKYNL